MWIRNLSLVVSTCAVAACGVASPGYRDVRADYGGTRYTPHPIDDGADLFAGESELRLDALTAAVLERNPSLGMARAGWREALARYPQATSYDDPRIGVTVAPLSFVDPDVRLGFGAEISQPLPYPGKRRLRGEVALAEAEAAADDYRATRLRLALMASQLYYDYFLIDRALAINAEHTQLLKRYSDSIDQYLVTGKMYQEDALEVDVETAELARQRVTLEADRDVTVAQLNALLHRAPTAPLPPPPTELAFPTALAASDAELADTALANRPELRAATTRERGAAAGVDLADRNYYPDMRVTGTYNRMWPMTSHQFMVGLAIDLPLTRSRRHAAVDAAEARVARRRAEREGLADDIRREVDTAYRRVTEADRSAAVYRDQVMPAARHRVDAIRIGLDAGRRDVADVVRAERAVRSVELRLYSAIADAYRRRAELERAIGRPLSEIGGAP